MRCLRVTLTNLMHNPTRAEIASHERKVGESLFSSFNLEWAGWIVLEDTMCLSAQWIAPESQRQELTRHIEANEIPGREIALWQVDDSEYEEIRLI